MGLAKISQHWVIYVFCVLLVILSLFTIFGERGLLHLRRLREQKKKLGETSFLLRKENKMLRERIYGLRHDDQYLEKIAREELGLVRPGEIIYRFASSESEKNRGTTVSEPPFEPSRSSGQKSHP